MDYIMISFIYTMNNGISRIDTTKRGYISNKRRANIYKTKTIINKILKICK